MILVNMYVYACSKGQHNGMEASGCEINSHLSVFIHRIVALSVCFSYKAFLPTINVFSSVGNGKILKYVCRIGVYLPLA